jgi:diguanylate cyclase (GGDEF)-like protein
VARFGGDEFVVMLSELDTDKTVSMSEAHFMAEKIHTSLSDPYQLILSHEDGPDTSVEHHCSASMGVVVFVDHQGDAGDIIKWADTAMYQAKEDGRNSISFYEPDGHDSAAQ